MVYFPIRQERRRKPSIAVPALRKNHWSTNGLVGAWIFNEQCGDTFFDLTKDNAGIYSVPNPSTYGRGVDRYGRSLVMSGGNVTEQLSLGSIVGDNLLSLSHASTFTVSCRARYSMDNHVSGGSDYFRVIDKSNGTLAEGGWGFGGVTPNASAWARVNVSGPLGQPSNFWIANEWHSYGVRGGSATSEFWRDASMWSSTASLFSTAPTTTTDASIGNQPSSAGRQFPGQLDHIFVYDRELSDAEFASIQRHPTLVLAPRKQFFFVGAAGNEIEFDFNADTLAAAGAQLDVSRELSAPADAQAGAAAALEITRQTVIDAAALAGAAAALEITRQTVIDAAALAGVAVEIITVGTNPVVFDFTASAVAGAATALEIQRALDVSADARAGADSRIDLERGLAVDADALAGVTVLADVQRALALQSDVLAGVEFDFIVAAGGVVTLSFTADAVTTAAALLEVTRALEPRADVLAGAALKTGLELGLTFQADAQAGAAAQLELERQIAVQADVLADASVILGLALDSAMYTNPVAARDRTNPIAGRNRTNKVER